jgi:hypothetical protein
MKNLSLLTLLAILLVSCAPGPTPAPANAVADAPLPTATFTPEPTATFTPTVTVTPTNSPTPTETPVPQSLANVFPEKCTSQAIWTNAGASDEKHRGWIKIDNGYLIHFDVAIPSNLKPDDYILSPVNGTVINIHYVPEPNSAYAIEIKIDGNIAGIENIFQNTAEINFLSHEGKFPFEYSLSDVKSITIGLAHLESFAPEIEIGKVVKIGDPLATVDFHQPFRPKKIGYVFSLYMKNGNRYDFSPCLVENKDPFCKPQCYPGVIRCP